MLGPPLPLSAPCQSLPEPQCAPASCDPPTQAGPYDTASSLPGPPPCSLPWARAPPVPTDGTPLSELSWSSSLAVVAVSFSGLFTFIFLMLACLCCKKGDIGFKVSWGRRDTQGRGIPGPGLPRDLGQQGGFSWEPSEGRRHPEDPGAGSPAPARASPSTSAGCVPAQDSFAQGDLSPLCLPGCCQVSASLWVIS